MVLFRHSCVPMVGLAIFWDNALAATDKSGLLCRVVDDGNSPMCLAGNRGIQPNRLTVATVG